jgi:hypothetical protein
MASPLCSVDGSVEHIAHATTYGATVNLALVSTLGVNAVDFVIVGRSDSTMVLPTITEGALGTASFTFMADPEDSKGRSLLVETVVNGGYDQLGKQDPALRSRVLIGVGNANGVIPIASDESMERDAIVGWLAALNEILAYSGEGAVVPLVTAAASGKVNLFPVARRIFHSDGATGGGTWATLAKADCDAAFDVLSLSLSLLHGGGGVTGQILRHNGTYWAPSDETAHDTYYAGAGMTASGTTFNVIANADGSIKVNADDVQVGVLATDAQHGNRGRGSLHTNATTSEAGFESAADKAIVNAAITSLTSTGGTVTITDEDHTRNLEIPAAAPTSNIFLPVMCVVRGIPVGSALGTPHHSLYSGARFFNLTGDAYQGIWVSNGAENPASRATDCDAGATFDVSKPTVIPVTHIHETGDIGGFVVCNALTGTWTVGSNPVYSFSLVGADSTIADGYDVIDHTDCYCASTQDVADLTDFVNDGSLFDGYVLVVGQRVLLAKQTTDITTCGIYEVGHSEHWFLSRAGDLPANAVLSATSVHHVTVLYGNLWGSPTRWAFWGNPSVIGATVPNGGAFSLLNLDGREIFDGIVAASESNTTLFDAALSGEACSELRVVGKLTIDQASYDAWAEAYYVWEVWDSSALNGATTTDEGGQTWGVWVDGEESSQFVESTSSKPSGNDSSWKLYATSDTYTVATVRAYLALPSGYDYHVQVKKSGTYATLRGATNYYDTGTQLGSGDGWANIVDSGVFHQSTYPYIYLNAKESSVGSTSVTGYFAQLLITRIPTYVEPTNNALVDVCKTSIGTAWDNSSSGWDDHLTVLGSAGTVVARPCPYDRHVRLGIYCRKYTLQAGTTATYTIPADGTDYPW